MALVLLHADDEWTATSNRQTLDDLAAYIVQPAWHRLALCTEYPALDWFPGRGDKLDALRAVCARCSVRSECLDAAMAGEEKYGIWGGLSERERRRIRSAR